MTAPDTDGIYAWISEEVYHGDKDSLSSGGARQLIRDTPLEFFAQLQEPRKPKKQFDVGHVCHKMVLGEGGQIVVVDAVDWTRKVARDKRDWAHAEGKVPVLKAQMDEAQRMAGQVYAHPVASALLAEGNAELSGWWHDPETGIRCRFRPDFIPNLSPRSRPVVVDYKTAASANPKAIARSAADYGYHCQGAWYLDGLEQTTGITGALFVLVVQSKTPPYAVAVGQFDPEDIERGRVQNGRAKRIYAACREAGVWPGYEGISLLSLPGWARRDMDEENTMEGEM